MQSFYEPSYFGSRTNQRYGDYLSSLASLPSPGQLHQSTPTTMGGFQFFNPQAEYGDDERTILDKVLGQQTADPEAQRNWMTRSAYDAPPVGQANLANYGMGQIARYGLGSGVGRGALAPYGTRMREEYLRWR